MSKNRVARLAFAMIVLVSLLLIGHNGYRHYLNNRLIAAVETRNVAVVRALLERGANPNILVYSPLDEKRRYGAPLLNKVMDYYSEPSVQTQEIACLLIEHGADIPKTYSYRGYLEKACEQGTLPVVRALLAHGADATAVNATQTTPLDAVVDFIGRDTTTLRHTPWSPTSRLQTGGAFGGPIAVATYVPKVQSYGERLAVGKAILHLLEQHGARLTPWQAIRLNDLAALRAAVDSGIDLERKEHFQAGNPAMPAPTLLQVAAQCGNAEAVRLLLKRGANVNAFGEGNPTALYEAISRKYEEIARLLMGNYADVNVGLPKYSTFQVAVHQLPPIVPDLIKRGADLTRQGMPALCEAITSRQPALVTLLLHEGVHCEGEAGHDALIAAIQYQPALVPRLLSQGAEGRETRTHPQSLLYEAVRYSRAELLLPLVRAGASINAVDNGMTPLQLAVGQNEEMVNLLLAQGADPNKVGGLSLTPLRVGKSISSRRG